MSKKYKVLIPCRKDDRKPYRVGVIITGKEFSKEAIENWLEIGVLEEVEDGSDD